jgi:hypothetical protein
MASRMLSEGKTPGLGIRGSPPLEAGLRESIPDHRGEDGEGEAGEGEAGEGEANVGSPTDEDWRDFTAAIGSRFTRELRF